jgi:hypothetical protein
LAIVTVFDEADPDASRLTALAGIAMNAVPMKSKHIQLAIQRNEFLVMIYFP